MSFNSGAVGKHFLTRHDLKEFDDVYWVERRNKIHMSIRLVLLEMRCDWSAFCELAGYRPPSHTHFPCPCCDIPLASLKDVDKLINVTLEGGGDWVDFDSHQYHLEVQRCAQVRPIIFSCYRKKSGLLKWCLKIESP